jgi:hypothetical protein
LQEVKIRIEQLEDRVMVCVAYSDEATLKRTYQAERARRKQIETENTELKGKLEVPYAVA